jgi:transposase-like protein
MMSRIKDAELYRRVIAEVRAGASVASVARSAGIDYTTARRWIALAGDAAKPEPPEIMSHDPPPTESLGTLISRLKVVADAVAQAGSLPMSAVILEAISELSKPKAAVPVSDAPDAGEDPRGWIVWTIKRTQRSLDNAEKTYNAQAAKQYCATLERLAARLKQYDSMSNGVGMIQIPEGALEAKKAELRAVLAALTTDTPLCAECGRRIRASWGA